jgi:hypothetical protein
MAIPYVKQTWGDGAGAATPISAARLGVLEQGVFDAHAMACARVYHNASQATTTGVGFVVALNSERFDADGLGGSTIHDVVTNNSRLTARVAGVYLITACIEWSGNATGQRSLSIRLNGATNIANDDWQAVGGSYNPRNSVATLYKLAVNDYVEMVALQDSGAGLTVNSSAAISPEFAMARVATG